MYDDDVEDVEDGFINHIYYFFVDPPVENDLLTLPEIEPYDGSLHVKPNVYALDADFEIESLIAQRKKRHADVSEGGELYELYHSTFWK